MAQAGKLLVCPTPIGNLGDVTLRVLDALRNADLIAAEDTRRTRKLLTHYGISAALASYHARNGKSKALELLRKLKSGATVALVSDAGMPGISDPGHRLIRACIEQGIDVEVLPGPNAALTAVVASALPTDVFTFAGFPPRRAGARRRFFEGLIEAGHTFVFYESPHRVLSSVGELAEACGECDVAVARELTKMFEEILRGRARDVAKRLAKKEPKGEYVVVVAPPPTVGEEVRPETMVQKVSELEKSGVDRKEAMRRVAQDMGVSRRVVYDAVVRRR